MWPLTNRNCTLENLKTNVCPFADRFKVDASVDESLCQVSSARSQRVGPDGYRSGHLICFEEFNCLRGQSTHAKAYEERGTSATENN